MKKHDEPLVELQEPRWDPDEEECEDLSRYCDGGFCPVSIWQKFHDGRYCVVYKLGDGYFSTVWLAQDLQEMRYVALKILTADQFGQSSEADILCAFASSVVVSPDRQKYVASLLDSFDYESSNGNHHILVLQLSRPLMPLRKLGLEIDFPMMVKDLLLGLDSIHAAGIVHGDIHLSNIGFHSQDLSDAQFQNFVPPQCHIVPPNGTKRPVYLVSRQEWIDEIGLDRGIRGQIVPQILDFGSAFKFSERKAQIGKPVAMPFCYRPPEHVLNRNPSQPKDNLNYGELNQKTDIWALGATIFEIAAGRSLVQTSWSSTEKAPYLQIDERLPLRWQGKWENAHKTGPSHQYAVERFWKESLELFEDGPISVGDHQLFKHFILGMVCLDPEKRLGTQDLLRHEYIAGISHVNSCKL